MERTPINVKNGNRLKRMAGLAASVEGFILSFSPGEVMIPPSAHNLTIEDFIAARGWRFPDLGGALLSSALKQEDKSSYEHSAIFVLICFKIKGSAALWLEPL